MIFIFILIGIFSASIMEYFLHRYYLHQPTHNHIVEHHKIFLEQFENSYVSIQEIVSKPGYIFFSSLLSLILTVVFYFTHGPMVFILYISALLYLIWVEVVHFIFHSPRGHQTEQKKWFKNIKEHHHMHHVKFKFNYSIGSTWMDYILKTKLK